MMICNSDSVRFSCVPCLAANNNIICYFIGMGGAGCSFIISSHSWLLPLSAIFELRCDGMSDQRFFSFIARVMREISRDSVNWFPI
jgi:hypothetical protein